MKMVIVLAMHGSPPGDFPRSEFEEFFRLHSMFGHQVENRDNPLYARYLELESKMRSWPRSAGNDPYWAGAKELAAELAKASGIEVITGFNEFCGPSLDEALEEAASLSPDKVIVVTPMMTKGGEHAEQEIPQAIIRAKARHPRITFIYLWPFETKDVARFLTGQIERFI